MSELHVSPVADVLLQTPLLRGPGAEPLQRQLLQRLRAAIWAGRLPAGCRLPGSRALAVDLAVSRNSVTAVYEQLGAEGYIEPSRQGTRVAALGRGNVPAQAGQAAGAGPGVPSPSVVGRAVGQMAERVARVRPGPAATMTPATTGVAPCDAQAFRPGVPALARFPMSAWKRSVDRAYQRGGVSALGYGDPAGEPALRQALSRHLAVARGVLCTPEQVVITEGAQEALALCVRLVANPGDTAWLEDPGYRGAQTAFACGDMNLVPMPVDGAGLAVPEGAWAAQPPRLVYTSPSHQYPTGAVLSAARRLALIQQAQRHGAWLIEDDYDSEFRHAGELIGAIQGLQPGAPVLYVGTFSKTLFPALRLGFVVLPAALAAQAHTLLHETLRGGHRFEQLALADFIDTGQFTRHLGRMRRLYRRRQQALREALAQHLAVPHQVLGGDSGMHLTVQLPPDCPDTALADAARAYDMAPAALSRFALVPRPGCNGLVLGYGNTSESQYPALVQRLSALALQALRGGL